MVHAPADLPGVARWDAVTVQPGGIHRILPNPKRSLVLVWNAPVARFFTTDPWRLLAYLPCSLSQWSPPQWSPDGSTLATAVDGRLTLVTFDGSVATSQPVADGPGGVGVVAWSLDGTLAVGTNEGGVTLWAADGSPANELPRVFLKEQKEITELAWSGDGKRLSARTIGGEVAVWSVEDAEGTLIPLGEATCFRLAWHPTEPRLALRSGDGRVRLWTPGDAETRPLDGAMAASGDGQSHVTLAWSPDGRRLAAGDEKGLLRVWDADGTPVGETRTDGMYFWLAAWSPDGATLATCSYDGRQVRFWTPDARPLPDPPGHEYANAIAWHADGRLLVAAHRGGTENGHGLYALKPGGSFRPLLPFKPETLIDLAWDPAGRHVAAAGEDGTLRVWSAGGQLLSAPLRIDGWISHVSWTPDGHVAASAGGHLGTWRPDGTVSRPAGMKPNVVGSLPDDVAWEPRGELAVARTGDGYALRSLTGGSDRPLTGVPAGGSAAWRPDGGGFVIARADALRFFDRDGTPGPVAHPTDGGTFTSRPRWSPDGTTVAVICNEKTIEMWDAAGRPVQPFGSIEGNFSDAVGYRVSWSPDGSEVAALTRNGNPAIRLRVWPGGVPVLDVRDLAFCQTSDWSRGGRIAATNGQGGLIVTDPDRSRADWTAICLGDGTAVSFSAAGEVIGGDPKTAETQIAYVLQYADGRSEVLTPAAFLARYGKPLE